MRIQSKDLITSKSISVVIATLGGEILRNTIERLNCGSVIPNEILICIPSECLKKVTWPLPSNTRIIQTECDFHAVNQCPEIMSVLL